MDNDMNLIISNNKIKLPNIVKILLVIIFILVLFLSNYKVSIYDIYNATIVQGDDDYYVQVFVPLDKQDFLHNREFLINDNTYKYEIVDIDDNYVDYDNNKYMIVKVQTKLSKAYKFNNYYLQIKQNRKEKSLFNLILEKMKKGMNL